MLTMLENLTAMFILLKYKNLMGSSLTRTLETTYSSWADTAGTWRVKKVFKDSRSL